MVFAQKKSLRIFGILLLGLALGTGVGFLAGLYASVQAAEFVLRDYSHQLIHQADEAAEQVEKIQRAFDHIDSNFCSDAEIASMRAYMFRSPSSTAR